MQVTFESDKASINEKTMVWVPALADGRVTWDCSGGDMPRQYRPKQCREGKFESAQKPASVKRVVADNGLVDLVVPQSWKPYELSEGAIVQLANPYSEAYLMVHFDNRADLPDYDLKRYADAVIELMLQNLVEPKIQFLKNSPVNELPALHYRIDTSMNNLDIIYLVTIVQGREQYYQLISWSLASRFSGNEDDFSYAIASFRERGAGGQSAQ